MASTDARLRIAHIGDLHFWHVPLNPFLLLNKRLLGVGNLLVGGRARRFRQELAPSLSSKVAELRFNAVLFSGDFTTTSLATEFQSARNAFSKVAAEAVTYSVPGNHDCYLPAELDAHTLKASLTESFHPESGISLTLLSPRLGLIQLNATTSNGIGSHGRITTQHIDFLEKQGNWLKSNFNQLILLCHFPAEDPPGVLKHDRGPQLRDADPFLRKLQALGLPVLWLHGHHHHRWIYGSPTVPGLIYLNAGAPLMRRKGRDPDLGFHEIAWHAESLSVKTHFLSTVSDGWSLRDVPTPAAGEYLDLQDDPALSG